MTFLVAAARRSLWLLVLAAGGGAAWSWYRDRKDDLALQPPEWPPLEAPTAPAAESDESLPAEPASLVGDVVSDDGWVASLDDGSCPLSHPVKANDNSGIFHVPGGRFYDRTKPERCYTSADAAVADGYRQATN